ncbi:hypothetical protein, conserved [Eimeria brunetti]|uniref:Uncharacterized protein n=1 Tax=Eimeria brunetti TaxID=51314 RepID=U6LYB9_9EIME|nr:hypothetical protein, conserved [Eimeria brunetti]
MEIVTDPFIAEVRDRHEASHESRGQSVVHLHALSDIQASKASSYVAQRPADEQKFLFEREKEEGGPVKPFERPDLFKTIFHPPTRQLLVEVMRFTDHSQKARKGFSGRFAVQEPEGVQLQVDVRLEEEGKSWHMEDTVELLAGYLEAAVHGSIGEAQEKGGASERSFSLFSFTGDGRIDFFVRATVSQDGKEETAQNSGGEPPTKADAAVGPE